MKKQPEQWKREILAAAKELFLSKGYEETAITDIMEAAGGAKGMFYRFFQSKEEVMHALADQMFFANNPFEEVRKRSDLNGLRCLPLTGPTRNGKRSIFRQSPS